MSEIRIIGGKPLAGRITIQGSKNAALPMMAASLLHRGVSVLKDCPQIADVECMTEILKCLGARVRRRNKDLYLDCSGADGTVIPEEYTGRMRSSVILMGAVLARNGHCRIGYPGGCVIGKRPIDLHLQVLRELGAAVREEENGICAELSRKNGQDGAADGTCKEDLPQRRTAPEPGAENIRFRGCAVQYSARSVGATEQGILAAVLAEGETILSNCAREPEIGWLCRFLRSMGAKIRGDGSSTICITGVKTLQGTVFEVPPDRIVAGTYLCAAAATRGRIVLHRVPLDELGAFLSVFQKMGGQYKGNSGKLIADAAGICKPVSGVKTDSWPGFPTDLQSPLMAALATVPGESRICENVFEDRFKIVEELRRMGADIKVSGREALICGGIPLKGGRLSAMELRGGAALVVAALAAEGESRIEGGCFIRRGYENICKDLTALGGRIREDTGITFYENIQLQEKNRNQ